MRFRRGLRPQGITAAFDLPQRLIQEHTQEVRLCDATTRAIASESQVPFSRDMQSDQ